MIYNFLFFYFIFLIIFFLKTKQKDEEASRAFVLVVFLSDEYLGFSQNLMYYNSAIFRFFKIASQLPQELQMILCRRVFDLPFIIIHSTDIRASVSWVLSKLTR